MNIWNISILLITLTIGCSSYESSFEEKPLTIDGSPSDWQTTLDQKGNISFTYGISNDSINLYLRLNTNDQTLQRKILMSGLTVWIDTTGKKNKTLGVTCPLAMHPGSKIREPKNQNPDWGKNQLLEAEFIGFNNQPQRYFISKNPHNVEISLNIDEFKSLFYELKIPFSSMGQNYTSLVNKPFNVCIEIDGIDMPSGPPANGRPSNMSGNKPIGGSGGRPNGGKGGAPGGRPDQYMMQNLSGTTRLWVRNIQLAP